jgi:hypothetical protein
MARTQAHELAILARCQLMGARQMRGRQVAMPTPAEMTLRRAGIDLARQLAARRIQRRTVNRSIHNP